jgi:uncharacterized protein YqjF (DUF2071 family)
MHLPVIHGTIQRRILANYHADPAVVQALIPQPFRPKLVDGCAMVGICLIRLAQIRPRFMQLPVGISSENAAHRIAVEWDEHGVVREGVYIARRDTSSWMNTVVGGRLFPGEHHHARFTTKEDATRIHVHFESDDNQIAVTVTSQLATDLPRTSLFASLTAASDFFAGGARGYSVTHAPQWLDGLELKTRRWHVEPLAVDSITSSFFDDPIRFPKQAIQFDCALLMRNIAHEWHNLGQMHIPPQNRANRV